jgi:hypothetical protein
MSLAYEPTHLPRFTVETVGGREVISIPPPRKVVVIVFLAFWVCAWTIGGLAALLSLLTNFQPFTLIWLCFWALAELFVFATLAWMLTGVETLRILGTDLEVGYRLLGFWRRKLYRGGDISGLSASDQSYGYGRRGQMTMPFFFANALGSVKFTYGARTIYLAAGLDESEGKLIVERLRDGLHIRA